MKLYFGIIDPAGNLYTSVSQAQPMDLLKQIFISLPTGEFVLTSPKIADRVEEINELWKSAFEGMTTPIEVIDELSRVLTVEDDLDAQDLADGLMIFELVNQDSDLVDFLMGLRDIFSGTEYDVHSLTEAQTTIIVRIEM